MIMLRWAGPRLAGGIGAALALVGGLVGLATSVERSSAGLEAAVMAGLGLVPITLVWLAPLCCGAGAALVMARVMACGEDVGLAALGLGPRHTVWVAAGAGLLMGACAWGVADRVIPALPRADSPSDWVWLESGAYRPADGILVHTSGGRITAVEHRASPSRVSVDRARQRARPRTASARVLYQTDTLPAQVERQGRLARVLSCVAMAMLGWVPWVRRSAAHIGLVLATGLCGTALELGLHALAAQGQVSPALGAWSVPLLLLVLAALSARR
jgi:hypothetical protein